MKTFLGLVIKRAFIYSFFSRNDFEFPFIIGLFSVLKIWNELIILIVKCASSKKKVLLDPYLFFSFFEQ